MDWDERDMRMARARVAVFELSAPASIPRRRVNAAGDRLFKMLLEAERQDRALEQLKARIKAAAETGGES